MSVADHIATLEAARDGRLIEIDMQFTRLTDEQAAMGFCPCGGKRSHTRAARQALKLRLIYMCKRHDEMPDYRYCGLTRHGMATMRSIATEDAARSAREGE